MLEKNPTTLKIVFKNFPLRSHKYAITAAIAALAAGRQGKFWEFHDELYRVYKQIDEQKITEIAQKLALNLVQFQQDAKDPAILQNIRKDYREGRRIGVRGIPSMYINGKKLRARTLDDFQRAIDKELKKSPTS